MCASNGCNVMSNRVTFFVQFPVQFRCRQKNRWQTRSNGTTKRLPQVWDGRGMGRDVYRLTCPKKGKVGKRPGGCIRVHTRLPFADLLHLCRTRSLSLYRCFPPGLPPGFGASGYPRRKGEGQRQPIHPVYGAPINLSLSTHYTSSL